MPKKNREISKKKRIIKLLVEILIFVIIFFAIMTWMKRGMIKGEPPRIDIVDLQGQAINFDSYAGEPMLLHFWASWCKICEFERGVVNAVSEDWPVLSIAMQSGDNETVKAFMQQKKISWRTVADENGAIANDYGVVGVPSSFILNKQGQIIMTDTGYTTSWGLRLRLWLAKVFY